MRRAILLATLLLLPVPGRAQGWDASMRPGPPEGVAVPAWGAPARAAPAARAAPGWPRSGLPGADIPAWTDSATAPPAGAGGRARTVSAAPYRPRPAPSYRRTAPRYASSAPAALPAMPAAPAPLPPLEPDRGWLPVGEYTASSRPFFDAFRAREREWIMRGAGWSY
ncbi:hypothetical protein M0638_14145 [Roseomonas sp. NAR14]|uniref:Translation initiation factor IF-2 n=1 Tax=Roseomonas acroporae TaxID=2937791 RepID=A0A9X1Y9F1_9PROT|nr:hypothetical protein [Roseomonas acroporae]MCK8785527.1 hypothetical protein [Roseomonas acroporae]